MLVSRFRSEVNRLGWTVRTAALVAAIVLPPVSFSLPVSVSKSSDAHLVEWRKYWFDQTCPGLLGQSSWLSPWDELARIEISSSPKVYLLVNHSLDLAIKNIERLKGLLAFLNQHTGVTGHVASAEDLLQKQATWRSPAITVNRDTESDYHNLVILVGNPSAELGQILRLSETRVGRGQNTFIHVVHGASASLIEIPWLAPFFEWEDRLQQAAFDRLGKPLPTIPRILRIITWD